MKKKAFLTLCVLAAILALALSGRRPFRDLQPSDVVSASAYLSPPDITVGIPDVPKLVSLLRDAVVYRRDDSYRGYSGQGVTYTLELQDGTRTTVTAFNPFLVIDGRGYRAKYKPCEALSRYANLLASPWGR